MDMPVYTRNQNKEGLLTVSETTKLSAKRIKDNQRKMDKFVQSKEKIPSIPTEEGTKDGKEVPVPKGAEGGMEISCVLARILEKVEPIEDINKKLEDLTKQMSEMTGRVTEQGNQLKVLKETTDQQEIELRQVGERLKLHEKQALNKSHINEIEMALQAENADLKERLVRLEEYSRRKNLLFNGFEESQGEHCVQLIHQYIRTQLQFQIDKVQIENAHRKGPKVPHKPRPIIVQFASTAQAQEVYKQRFVERNDQNGQPPQFRRPKVFVTRDLPEEIMKAQFQLRKVLKSAKKLDQDAHIARDKLIYKKKAYDLDACYSLKELEIEKIGTVQKINYVLFHGRFSPFSNFYPSSFVVDDKYYRCAEQYFQAEKARFLGRTSVACQIMYSRDPAKMKSLGNQLEEEVWPVELQEATMRRALLAKFGQNKRLCGILKETSDRALIECNKYDQYWGNGRFIYDTKASQGTGKNRLGQLLQEVRDLLE